MSIAPCLQPASCGFVTIVRLPLCLKKESCWRSVKAINENIGSDREGYRYLSLPFITNRILYV